MPPEGRAADTGMTGPHWAFSWAVYGAPGVERACLLLQERYGVDVNVLLLALHATVCRGAAPDRAGLTALEAAGRPLREGAVAPLRQVRRALKRAPYGADGQALRNGVKALELQAEQLEQSVLAGVAATLAPRAAGAAAVARAVVEFYAEASEHEVALEVLATDADAAHAITLIAEAAATHAAAG